MVRSSDDNIQFAFAAERIKDKAGELSDAAIAEKVLNAEVERLRGYLDDAADREDVVTVKRLNDDIAVLNKRLRKVRKDRAKEVEGEPGDRSRDGEMLGLLEDSGADGD
jgi:hypothetical protein